MSNQFIGCIILVGEVKRGISQSGKEWAKQEFVVETVEQYPRRCVLDIMGDENIQKLAVKAGENVTVDYNIDAHEYNGRWYNNLTAWKVTRMGGVAQPQPTAQTVIYQKAPLPEPQAPFTDAPQDDGKLPF